MYPLFGLMCVAGAMVSCGDDKNDEKSEDKEDNKVTHVFTDQDKALVKGNFCDCMEEHNDVRTCEKEMQKVLDDLSDTYELNDVNKRELFRLAGEWGREGC